MLRCCRVVGFLLGSAAQRFVEPGGGTPLTACLFHYRLQASLQFGGVMLGDIVEAVIEEGVGEPLHRHGPIRLQLDRLAAIGRPDRYGPG